MQSYVKLYEQQDQYKILQKLKEENSNLYQLAIDLAKNIYHDGASDKSIDKTGAFNETIFEKQDFFHISEEKIVFNNHDTLLTAVSTHLVETILLPSFDNNDQLCKALNKIKCEEYNLKIKGLYSTTIVILHNEYKKNIIEAFLANKDDDQFLQDAFPFIKDILPYLSIKKKLLYEFVKLAANKFKNSMLVGELYQAIERTTENQPELGKELCALSIEDFGEHSLTLTPHMLRGLSTSNFNQAVIMAEQLFQTTDEKKIILGICSLATLHYHKINNEKQVASAIQRLEKLHSNTCNEEVLSAITFAYGRLLKVEPLLQKKLIALSDSTFTRVIYELVKIIKFELKDNINEEWFNTILMKLTRIHTEHAHIMSELNLILFDIAKNDINKCYQFIEECAIQQSLIFKKCDYSITELFNLFFSSTKNHGIFLNCYLTKWFDSDNIHLHHAATDIIEYINTTYPDPEKINLSLDIQYLNQLNDKDIIYIINKLIGYIWNANALSMLVFSTLKREPLSDEIKNYVYSVFVDYIGYNFSATRDYLKNITITGTPVEVALATAALEELNSRLTERLELPLLEELSPPSQRVYLWNNMFKKVSQEAFNKARSKSPFLSITKNIPVKAGKSYIDGQGNEISLNQFSCSSEIPRGRLTDPIGQTVLRHKFKLEKKS